MAQHALREVNSPPKGSQLNGRIKIVPELKLLWTPLKVFFKKPSNDQADVCVKSLPAKTSSSVKEDNKMWTLNKITFIISINQ